ncbi:hypothetical protein TUN199_08779 [Pyrenophora tritici-repentis]|nr:hypothetical protein TUN199_08779 [Pyrenophora tritici-repentis]
MPSSSQQNTSNPPPSTPTSNPQPSMQQGSAPQGINGTAGTSGAVHNGANARPSTSASTLSPQMTEEEKRELA